MRLVDFASHYATFATFSRIFEGVREINSRLVAANLRRAAAFRVFSSGTTFYFRTLAKDVTTRSTFGGLFYVTADEDTSKVVINISQRIVTFFNTGAFIRRKFARRVVSMVHRLISYFEFLRWILYYF